MNKSDRNEFAVIMSGLGEIYDKPISKSIIEIYWRSLSEYSLSDVRKAATNIIKFRKYNSLPKPADFIEYINPEEDIDAKLALARQELIDRLVDGYWMSFYFEDPIINITMDRMGGWIAICEYCRGLTGKELSFWFKDEFEKLYRAYSRRPFPKIIPKMVGQFEIDNVAKKFLTDERGYAMKGQDGYIKIGSPEAQCYLESTGRNLLTQAEQNGTD